MASMRLSLPVFAALCLAGSGAGAASPLDAPAAMRNLSPLYANLSVPVMVDARVPEPGAWEIDWQFSWASHALREQAAAATLELDGETRRHDLSLRWTPLPRLRLQANLPWITHSGGDLDGLIDDWHAFWGMPDGPRASQPDNRLLFAYTAPQGFGLEAGDSGIGDAEVSADWLALSGHGLALSLTASLRLDTGDAATFTGAGEAGAAFGVRATQTACLWAQLTCHGQLGVTFNEVSPANAARRDSVPYYGVSLVLALTQDLALLAQLEGQGEVYTQAPLDAGGAPVWGGLGLRWQASRRWQLEALFIEDLAVGSAPDITFRAGLRRAF
jgi:hypothetical protein